MRLSSAVESIPASPTLAIATRARELKASGVDVISFSAGEPDFNTPDAIIEAAYEAAKDGYTRYTAVNGLPELKAAIRARAEARFGLTWSDAEIIASCGAKHTLYNLFIALLDPGDEVIVPTPAWVSYPTQVQIAGGTPVEVAGLAENGFVPTLDALNAAVTEKTRAIIINNPTNPTGALWSREALEPLAKWLVDHPNIVVVSDAIYDELAYDGAECVELLTLAPQLKDRYVHVNGISKSFAMTGWRLGWALAPKDLVGAMTRLQSQSTSNPTAMTQMAAVKALELGEEVIAPMRAAFERRRDLIYGLLSAIDGVEIVKPRGAFYAFPDLNAFIGRTTPNGTKIEDDLALAGYLLDDAQVALVPGSPFGAPGFVRLSYATDDATIEKGIARIADALGKLS